MTFLVIVGRGEGAGHLDRFSASLSIASGSGKLTRREPSPGVKSHIKADLIIGKSIPSAL